MIRFHGREQIILLVSGKNSAFRGGLENLENRITSLTLANRLPDIAFSRFPQGSIESDSQ